MEPVLRGEAFSGCWFQGPQRFFLWGIGVAGRVHPMVPVVFFFFFLALSDPLTLLVLGFSLVFISCYVPRRFLRKVGPLAPCAVLYLGFVISIPSSLLFFAL